jgi:hypothetical protein
MLRAVSRFSSVILADLAMRGFAISFLTLARVASLSSFFSFLCSMHHRDIKTEAIQSHFAKLRNMRSIPVGRSTELRGGRGAADAEGYGFGAGGSADLAEYGGGLQLGEGGDVEAIAFGLGDGCGFV